jgi:hypothetical protein
VKVLGSLVSTRIVGLQDSTSIMGALLTDRLEVLDRLPES